MRNGSASELALFFLHGEPHHVQTRAMMHAAQAAHPRRQGIKFLEHEVLHCKSLAVLHPSALPHHWEHMSRQSLGRALLQDMAQVTRGDSDRDLRQWEVVYGPLADDAVAWLAWAPLAKALVQGSWHADVTPCYRRSDTGDSCLAPAMPSARLMRYFLSMLPEELTPWEGDAPSDISVGHGTRRARVHIDRVMGGLQLGSLLRSQRLGDAAMAAAGTILSRAVNSEAAVTVATGMLPSRATLQRARVRLDVGAMLCYRWLWARERRPTFRYLAYDASPQAGVEFFCYGGTCAHGVAH